MEISEFNKLWDRCRAARPLMFAGATERNASEKETAKAELALGVRLPDEYKQFLRHHGGGYVGSINVFSVNDGSEWNIVTQHTTLGLPPDFVPVTDDETGGYYGFKVIDGTCSENVYYLHPDDGAGAIQKFSSFLTYVASAGLNIEVD